MATLQKRIAEWTSIAKDFAQIVALMGVGLWTLFVYLRTESPSSAGQIVVTASFQSSALSDGGCELLFEFSVENKGKTTARIEGLRIRGWSIDEITARTDKPRILSAHDLKGTPIVDQVIQQTTLLREIPPGEAPRDSFIILLPRGHARRVLVDGTIDVTIPGIFGGTPRPPINAYMFGTVCAVSSSSSDVITAPPK